jgi:hypothetical protein
MPIPVMTTRRLLNFLPFEFGGTASWKPVRNARRRRKQPPRPIDQLSLARAVTKSIACCTVVIFSASSSLGHDALNLFFNTAHSGSFS